MRLFAELRTNGGTGRRYSYPRLHCFGNKRRKSNAVAVFAKLVVAHRSPRFAEQAPAAASDRDKEEGGEGRRSASDALTLLPLSIDSFEGVLFAFDPSSDFLGPLTVVSSTNHRSCLVVICTLLSPWCGIILLRMVRGTIDGSKVSLKVCRCVGVCGSAQELTLGSAGIRHRSVVRTLLGQLGR
jgi:hypothetical protein